MLLDQVRDDFRVGFSGELVPFGDQLLLEREIALNNAIVHHHDSARAVAMRMGIFFSGAAMRGPAGVSDAVGAVEWLEADHFFQVAQLAFRPADLQAFTVSCHRDSRRVIAAILQLSKTLDDDGDHLLLTYISHDAAHWLIGSFYRWGTGDGSGAVAQRCSSGTNGDLVFEGETKLFNDRVRSNFARDPLYFRLRLIL